MSSTKKHIKKIHRLQDEIRSIQEHTLGNMTTSVNTLVSLSNTGSEKPLEIRSLEKSLIRDMKEVREHLSEAEWLMTSFRNRMNGILNEIND